MDPFGDGVGTSEVAAKDMTADDPPPRPSMRRCSPVQASSRVLRCRSLTRKVPASKTAIAKRIWTSARDTFMKTERGVEVSVKEEVQNILGPTKSRRKSRQPCKLNLAIRQKARDVCSMLDSPLEDGGVPRRNKTGRRQTDKVELVVARVCKSIPTLVEGVDNEGAYKEGLEEEDSLRPRQRGFRSVRGCDSDGRVTLVDCPRRRRRDVDRTGCKVCGRTFRRCYMAAHMRTHTGEKPFSCPNCDRSFSTECYLKMHVQSCHEDPRAFQCDVCQRNLASKGSLREHKRTHSEERPYQCAVCHKVFRQSALLNNHVKSHSNLTPYECEDCGNCYKYKRSMELHKERIHDGVRRSYPCAMCPKVFTRKNKLKDHTNWHLGKSPHLCEHCGKHFLSRKTLRTHLLIHQNLKPYSCEVCAKAFRQAHVLKRHLTTHTGVKPFRCSACQKGFIHRVYLERHACPRATRPTVAPELVMFEAGVAPQETAEGMSTS